MWALHVVVAPLVPSLRQISERTCVHILSDAPSRHFCHTASTTRRTTRQWEAR